MTSLNRYRRASGLVISDGVTSSKGCMFIIYSHSDVCGGGVVLYQWGYPQCWKPLIPFTIFCP